MELEKITAEESAIQSKEYEEGFEVVGKIKVLKIPTPGEGNEYKLELVIDDDLTRDILQYGADITNQVDLLQTGIRNGLINRVARLREK